MMEYIINHSHSIITNAKIHRCITFAPKLLILLLLSLFLCAFFNFFFLVKHSICSWNIINKRYQHTNHVQSEKKSKCMAKWFRFYKTVVHVNICLNNFIRKTEAEGWRRKRDKRKIILNIFSWINVIGRKDSNIRGHSIFANVSMFVYVSEYVRFLYFLYSPL